MAPATIASPAVPAHGPPHVGRPGAGLGWQARLDGLVRLGLVIRGIIYFVPGLLALRWALGSHREPMTQASAIDMIGQQPLGRALLIVVAIGLAGYAIWGVRRAVFDPLRRGHSPTGIAVRFGYGVSALAYAGLFVATIRFLTGSLSQIEQHRDWTVGLLARPFGPFAVVLIGLCWIFGSGLTQIVTGWRHGFDRDLALERVGPIERRFAEGLGRTGLVARGIVFMVIGVLLVLAPLHLHSRPGVGLEGALLEVARQPFGLTLLGAAGLGLMAFGIYSAMGARWMRLHGAPGGTRPSPSPQPTS